MTQNEKDLLLKDLCGRLPYDVFVNIGDIKCILQPHDISDLIKCDMDVKPYLFPLSSMTEEQRKEFVKCSAYERRDEDCGRHTELYYYDMVGHEDNLYPNYDSIDWLNANHFDYRGLIEMGLAIDATNLNIY